jgi:divalent metal cation (Fe/Co/Zn/Cd) transporter
MFDNKKGSDSFGMTSLIMGIAVATLVLIFLGSMAGTVWETSQTSISAIANNAVLEQSFIANNNSAVYLGYPDIQQGTLFVRNSTGYGVGLANFTIDYTLGTMLLGADSNDTWKKQGLPINSTTLYANFTHGRQDIRDSVVASAGSGFLALSKVGTFLPLVALAVVIFIILGLVLGLTGNKGGGQSQL